jgi:hypothetical protein
MLGPHMDAGQYSGLKLMGVPCHFRGVSRVQHMVEVDFKITATPAHTATCGCVCGSGSDCEIDFGGLLHS